MKRLAALALLFIASTVQAGGSVESLIHTLGYIGVDYPATVSQGEVVDAAEYAEQQEFAGRMPALIRALPPREEQAALVDLAQTLVEAVEGKVPGEEVATLTARLQQGLIHTWGVRVSPRRAPDPLLGATLYQEQCTACHGAEGYGDGPLASSLEPAPTNFHDPSRYPLRSAWDLFNTITFGVNDTAMVAFSDLSEEERWALAYYVANLPFSNDRIEAGESAWLEGSYGEYFEGLASISQATPAQVERQLGAPGVAVLAWLRSHPETIARGGSPLATALRQLDESLQHYRQGDREAAYRLAVSAYLDGFELAEESLATLEGVDVRALERRMMAYRALLRSNAPLQQVESVHGALATELAGLEDRLASTTLSGSVAFLGSLAILLREGMEAILLLAAIIAFVIKTGHRETLPWIHLGWASALLLGVATWLVAENLIAISGAGRELTEAVTALVASAMLLYVGIWLHSHRHSRRWQQFLTEKLKSHGGRAAWGLAALSFVAVYREVFETVLFYQALWTQGSSNADTRGLILAGMGTAATILLAVGIGIFRLSLRIPLKAFFGFNTVLMYGLAFVLAGKGIAALQEAGYLPIDAVRFPRIDLLGIYPNLQVLLAQAAILVMVGVLSWRNRQSQNLA